MFLSIYCNIVTRICLSTKQNTNKYAIIRFSLWLTFPYDLNMQSKQVFKAHTVSQRMDIILVQKLCVKRNVEHAQNAKRLTTLNNNVAKQFG